MPECQCQAIKRRKNHEKSPIQDQTTQIAGSSWNADIEPVLAVFRAVEKKPGQSRPRECPYSATWRPDRCLIVLRPVPDPRVVTRDGLRHYSALMPTVTDLFRWGGLPLRAIWHNEDIIDTDREGRRYVTYIDRL